MSPSHEDDIEITSPAAQHGTEDQVSRPLIPAEAAVGTASKPFEIQYSDDEPPLHRSRDRSPPPEPRAPAPEVVPGQLALVPHEEEASAEQVATAGIVTLAGRSTQDISEHDQGSDSETESDDPSSALFMSAEPPTAVANRLDLAEGTLLFGGTQRKVLHFSSGHRVRSDLQKAQDSFSFLIMEEDLGQESAEEILTHAQDLSMKAFVACHVAQRRVREDLRQSELSKQSSESALSKEIKVVKKLQFEKETLATALDTEKNKSILLEVEKNSLSKRNEELEAEVERLRALAQAAENEKSRADQLQLSLDAKWQEVEQLTCLRSEFKKLKKDHQEYTDAIDECFHYIHAEMKKTLTGFGSAPPPLNLKDYMIGDILKWVVDGIQSLGVNGRVHLGIWVLQYLRELLLMLFVHS